MSHHRYQTQGWILAGRPKGESSKYFFILTRDLGLVGATAQGVREVKSKLRYGLQDLMLSHIELVRGKDVWRLVGAEALNTLSCARADERKHVLAARIASLVRRLAPRDEEVHAYMSDGRVFEEIQHTLSVLEEAQHSNNELSAIELVCVARILDHFGYWGQKEKFAQIFEGDISDTAFLGKIALLRISLVREINKALEESQL